jgi:hypothetical protein
MEHMTKFKIVTCPEILSKARTKSVENVFRPELFKLSEALNQCCCAALPFVNVGKFRCINTEYVAPIGCCNFSNLRSRQRSFVSLALKGCDINN